MNPRLNDTLDQNHPVRKHPYTTTNSGVNVFSPDQFKACEVRMSDILDGISKICRYNGQVSEFYSVAEHSVLVSRIAELLGDEEAIIPALFHDAHEAYSGDIPTPHKRMLPALVGFEKGYEDRVREALGLPVPWDPVWTRVAKYDSMILHRELRVFRAPELLPRWYDPEMERAVPTAIQPVGFEWREARSMFRTRMHDLGWGLGGNA
jgi:hypothetical protein